MSEVPQKHLFDGTDLNVYETGNVVNLSAGAPGPDLLKECSNLFMKATEHRMVRVFLSRSNETGMVKSRLAKFQ